jgi:LCCL domain
MSRRERIGLVLGIAGALALVLYPLGFRLATGWDGESHRAVDVTAIRLPTPPPSSTPTPTAEPSPTGSPRPTPEPTPFDASWAATAERHRHVDGQRFDYACTAGGTINVVWGTDLYTDDSSVCSAAVHAGVITREDGGTVTIIIRPGAAHYDGSTRNGVVGEPYGAWEGSFEVVAP